jgi:hypothetical protein
MWISGLGVMLQPMQRITDFALHEVRQIVSGVIRAKELGSAECLRFQFFHASRKLLVLS